MQALLCRSVGEAGRQESLGTEGAPGHSCHGCRLTLRHSYHVFTFRRSGAATISAFLHASAGAKGILMKGSGLIEPAARSSLRPVSASAGLSRMARASIPKPR